MRSNRGAVLRADANDLWHRSAKYVLVPLLCLYLIRATLVAHHHETPWDDSTHNATSPSRSPTEQLVVSVARDTGLQMTTKGPLPVLPLVLHALCAGLMVLTLVVQKELAAAMAVPSQRGTVGRRGALVERLAFVLLPSAQRSHRVLGYASVGMMSAMAVAGIAMGSWPDPAQYPRFALYNVLFGLPWLLWSAALLFSARRRSYHWHRFWGNMALRGCIAVPLARICGALLQRCAGWPEAQGYYTGIGTAAAVIGLWELMDIAAFVQQPTLGGPEEASAKDRAL